MSDSPKKLNRFGVPNLPMTPQQQSVRYQIQSDDDTPKRQSLSRNNSASRCGLEPTRPPTPNPGPAGGPLTRRNSQSHSTVNCLHSELLDIKSQVARLLSQNEFYPQAQSSSEMSENFDQRSSATRPSRVFNPMVQLEADFLREELTLMQKKYYDRKKHHREEKAHLQRKIQFLQQMLEANQRKVEEYKNQISMEIYAIEKELVENGSANTNTSRSNSEELRKMQEELETLERQFVAQKEEADRVKEEVWRLEQYAETQRNDRETMRELVVSLKEENWKLRIDNEKRLKVNQDDVEVQTSYIFEDIEQKQKDRVETMKQQHKKQIDLITKEKQENQLAAEEGLSNLIQQIYEKDDQIRRTTEQVVELTKKLEGLKSANKQQQAQFVSLKSQVKASEDRINALDAQLFTSKQKCLELESALTQFKQQVSKLKQELSSVKQEDPQLEKHLSDQSQQIQSLNKQLKAKQTLIWRLEKEGMELGEEFKKRIMVLENQQQTLAEDMETKCQLMELQDKENEQINKLYKDTLKELNQRTDEFNQYKEDYRKELKQRQEEVDRMRKEWEVIEKDYKAQVEDAKKEWLTKKIETIKKAESEVESSLKLLLRQKQQQISKLKKYAGTNQLQLEHIRIQQDKNNAIYQKKTLQIQSHNLKSQLDVQRRTCESLSSKIRYLLDQIKKKDEFIQKHIVNRKLLQSEQQSLENFFKQYAITFQVEGIHEKLNSEHKELGLLKEKNKALTQEITTLKENGKEQSTSNTLAQDHSKQNTQIGFQSFIDKEFE